jgi:splicing factor U2AF subunit
VKPTYSQAVLIPNMYLNPAHDPNCTLTPEQLQQHFDLFYEDIFVELGSKYGEIEELFVCENIGDHLIGNIYVRFKNEEDASKAVEDLNKRWYAGRPVFAELSPVTDFRESCCRQHEQGECTRGGYCNFMHFKVPTMSLKKSLIGSQLKTIRIHDRK